MIALARNESSMVTLGHTSCWDTAQVDRNELRIHEFCICTLLFQIVEVVGVQNDGTRLKAVPISRATLLLKNPWAGGFYPAANTLHWDHSSNFTFEDP